MICNFENHLTWKRQVDLANHVDLIENLFNDSLISRNGDVNHLAIEVLTPLLAGVLLSS